MRMSLSVGIVGLPNVGKSTLFNAMLNKQQALAANYPFATIEPNTGVVPVPDERLEKLAQVVAASRGLIAEGGGGKERLSYTNLPPKVPATVTFVDIAGIVEGAHKGEGLGNKFLSHIREVDAIAFVVRAFNNPDVVQTGSGNFGSDIETIKTELIMKDLETLGAQREPKGKVSKEDELRYGLILKLTEDMNKGRMVSESSLSRDERHLIEDLHLLTMKPALYVVNVGEDELKQGYKVLRDKYADYLSKPKEVVIVICAKAEEEISALNKVEQFEYLKSLGLESSGLERLIKASYATLNLISFLTVGEKEVRAWTIRERSTAVEAAGVIHTDFSKNFIKADVVEYGVFVSLGGWKKARDAGKARSEGRDYLMKDGDVVEFRVGV